MRSNLSLLVVAFAVTLAVIVGSRLSTEAMAILVGVVSGVAVSVPVGLVFLLLSQRQAAGMRGYLAGLGPIGSADSPGASAAGREWSGERWPAGGGVLPYTTSAANTSYLSLPAGMPPVTPWAVSRPREFRIIGEEAE